MTGCRAACWAGAGLTMPAGLGCTGWGAGIRVPSGCMMNCDVAPAAIDACCGTGPANMHDSHRYNYITNIKHNEDVSKSPSSIGLAHLQSGSLMFKSIVCE